MALIIEGDKTPTLLLSIMVVNKTIGVSNSSKIMALEK